jgi:S1-C subfamily serine protease
MGAALMAEVRALCVSGVLIATASCPALAQPADDIQELRPGAGSPATAAVMTRVSRSVVQVVSTVYGTSPGSGVLTLQRVVGAGAIVAADGYILTAGHVVADAMQVEVILAGDTPRVLPARVVGLVADLDLAILRVQALDAPALPLAHTPTRAGDPTWTVAPTTRPDAAAIVMGIVLATGAPMRTDSPVPYLVTDASPMVAGAPVVNGAGELVGLASAFVDEPGAARSVTMALPAALLDATLTQVRAPSALRRGVVGLSAHSVARQGRSGPSAVDLVVSGVTPGLPASRAGVRPGDVIVAVNHQPVDGMDLSTLYLALYTLREGEPLRLAVERDGTRLDVSPTAVAVDHVALAQ